MSGGRSRKNTPPPGDLDVACPLCLEEMDSSDCRFKPCPCGYQICRFCWHRIREEGNERCPACRRVYTDEDVEFLPETEARPARPKEAELPPPAPATPTPAGVLPSKRHLVDIRVVQRNLVYVIGISARIAHEHILKEPEFFGQFGKILKIVVNRRNVGPAQGGSDKTTTSGSAYVTFNRPEEAQRAIALVNDSIFDGRILKATYGTTKYCSYFLRGVACPNAGCMYLHEEGDDSASYTKEALSAGNRAHMSSTLVDGAEGAAYRQFGTIMYRPAPLPPRPTSPATTTTMGHHHHQQQQVPVTEIISSSGDTAVARPQTPAIQTLPLPPPPPISPPINLAEYEGEALSFLNRLARWNSSMELDLEQHLPPAPRTPHASAHELFEDDSSVPFDPFYEGAVPKPTPTRRNFPVPQSASSAAVATAQSAQASASPMIAKGPLPGFDWSAVVHRPVPSETDGGSGSGFGASPVLFRKSMTSLPCPAPVGSPMRAPGFEMTAPVRTNLEQLFSATRSERVGEGRKVVDATQLERQFFLEQPPSGAGRAEGLRTEGCSSSSSSNGSSNDRGEGIKTDGKGERPPAKEKEKEKEAEREKNKEKKRDAGVISGSVSVAPVPIQPAVAVEAPKPRKKGPEPFIVPPVAPRKEIPLPEVRSSVAASKKTKAKREEGNGSSSGAVGGSATAKSPTSPGAHSGGVANQFAALLEEETAAGGDSDVSNRDDESADTLPAGEAPASKNREKEQQQQQQKQQKQPKQQELPNVLETPSQTAEGRRPPPALASQPNYRLEWGGADNNYTLRAPNFEVMSDTERTEWRAWLAEERRAIETEEAQLRRKTIDLHRQVATWMGAYIRA